MQKTVISEKSNKNEKRMKKCFQATAQLDDHQSMLLLANITNTHCEISQSLVSYPNKLPPLAAISTLTSIHGDLLV
jgi:hypothetical protein